MLDFTSSLYLGVGHPWWRLRPWAELTPGTPAALRESPATAEVADGLATLTRCRRVVLAPSTLHLFQDLFAGPSMSGRPIFIEAGTYPIARWGAERAASRGAGLKTFGHHSAGQLARALRGVQAGATAAGGPPVVLCDGVCPSCGKPAPLAEYLELVRRWGGTLVVDDTQAMGILGGSRQATRPWGRGGGGSLRWAGISGPDVIVIASLAKGFGVPLAMLGGTNGMVREFEDHSDTRVHCSPPSAAVLSAATHALAVNATRGDALRDRLLASIERFRRGVIAHRLTVEGDVFPVQSLVPTAGRSAIALHQRLLGQGLRTIVSRDRHHGSARVSLVITVRHRDAEIDRAIAAIAAVATRRPQERERAPRQAWANHSETDALIPAEEPWK